MFIFYLQTPRVYFCHLMCICCTVCVYCCFYFRCRTAG